LVWSLVEQAWLPKHSVLPQPFPQQSKQALLFDDLMQQFIQAAEFWPFLRQFQFSSCCVAIKMLSDFTVSS